ncbi:MAG: ArsA family ATPase [Desulfosalsimonadaceae bacterium]
MTDGNSRDNKENTQSPRDGIAVVPLPQLDLLQSIFSRRVIFVLGKGGAGKTTATVALGMAAQRMNKRVLLVEIGDSDTLGSICLNRTLSETPEEISSNLWGARVHPKAELEAYIHAHVSSGFIARKIIRSRLFSYLFDATPGLKEVMSLARIWRWEKETNKDAEPRFDLIIVDAPATGHALSLLRLPEQLIRMIRVGPVANQIRELQRLLKNPQKTCLVLVTLPEELPVNEAMEFYSAADDELEMPVAVTLINCVYPSYFTQNELNQINALKDALKKHPGSPGNAMLDSALRLVRRRDMQQKYIDQIQARTLGRMKEMPFYFTNDLTLEDIDALSHHLTRSLVHSI